MTAFTHLTRRRFLWTPRTAAEAVTLKGCTLTPPSPSNLFPKAQALSLSPADLPGTTWSIDYSAIVESAPLISAQEKGFFALQEPRSEVPHLCARDSYRKVHSEQPIKN